MRIVYVIGVPGSGKSTAVATALGNLGFVQVAAEPRPVPHVRYTDDEAWQIGRVRESFSGTDAMGMAVNPVACAWVLALRTTGREPESGRPAPLLLVGEGDRLANQRFLTACDRDLSLVWIDTPLPVARLRASMRARQLGVPEQSESWWKGRATKTANLAAWGLGNVGRCVRIDGNRSASLVADDLTNEMQRPT